MFVKEDDGGMRICVDYRALNGATIKSSYPLPNIDDILKQLKGSCVFTKVDIRSGYHQLKIKVEDIRKTAFTTRYGLYEFVVMTHGLANVPLYFKKLMTTILKDYHNNFVLILVDDVIIYSKNAADHREHLRLVLGRFRKHKLYSRYDTCEFWSNDISILGYIISDKGVKVDPAKVEAIHDWKTPTSVPEVRSLVKLAGYYRRFIEWFCKIVRPLSQILKKEKRFEWTDKCEKSFQELRTRLISAPVLVRPDFHKEFEIYCDASQQGLGCVLM